MKRKLLFIGPVLTASGYGVHARQLLKALNDSGDFDIAVESLRWGDTPFLQDESLGWIRLLSQKKHEHPDVAVQVTIPNEFRRRAPLMVGVTAGIEVDRVSPDWLMKCNAEVDFVVVPSEHSRRSFIVEYQGQDGNRLRLEKPIFVVHEGVDTAVFKPTGGEGTVAYSTILTELDVPAKNFVFVGLGLDKADGRDRKNVTKLVEWFCKAFNGSQSVGLILKTSIVNGSLIDFEITKKRISDIKLGIGCKDFPKIFLVHGRMTEEEMANVYRDPRVVASVSFTHGEGFGLPLIEAAATGLPVLATDWSGHLDFLTKDGKKLFVPVEADLQEIYKECVWPGVMNEGSRWAVPKEADAITKMQKLILSSDTPRKWAAELAQHISEKFSLPVTGTTFVDLVKRAAEEVSVSRPSTRESLVTALRSKVSVRGKSLIYTMPMSAGDVFLSTSILRALRKKHPQHVIYFATQPEYFTIARDFADEVIEWQPWMQDVSVMEEIFDEVYSPNLAVQMVSSNWIHSGRGRNLIDEFAVQCGINPSQLEPPRLSTPPSEQTQTWKEDGTWVALHTGGQKGARAYAHWTELVKNIRAAGIKVAQVGAKDDISVGEVDNDFRGALDYTELPYVLDSCKAFVGIDSFPMHVAAAYGLPVVALFGSSYPSSTGPRDFNLQSVCDLQLLVSKQEVMKNYNRLKVLETPSRNGCEKACYKDTCRVDAGNPCINNITPYSAWLRVLESCDVDKSTVEYKTYRPKISGYTHILNPKTHGYPYIQSINSMLGFCDEVVVVDGGSTDGSLDVEEFTKPLLTGQLKIITREWDAEEPGMDGMQKAFGRAMVSSDAEFLWQQDADEVVHENDYNKILDTCKRFPADVDVLHLPVVELWGDQKHVRTDRHSWKWRLSRNNLRVTHGINIQARSMDPKTGRFFAKKGMSDGCEMIDIVTGEHLPHRGFYNKEIEALRVSDPTEYGRVMNETFNKLPSVWHYSWADLNRKVKNFRDFWDKQWQVLYQTPPEPRFPDIVTDDDVQRKADELLTRGGEHGRAATFVIDQEPPHAMKGWV